MNRAELTAAVVWLDQLAARAGEHSDRLRARLAAEAKAEYDANGTVPSWRIPDAATVSGSVSKRAVYVADEAVFAAWVAATYPEATEVTVRDVWSKAFLRRLDVDHEGVVDPATGVVVPGVAVRPGGTWRGISITALPETKGAVGHLAGEALKQVVAAIGGPMAAALLAELEAVPAEGED